MIVSDMLLKKLDSVMLVLYITTTVLRPFVRNYSGEPVPEETLTYPPTVLLIIQSLSASSIYHDP